MSTVFQPPWNFLGLSEECAHPARAAAWIFPIPYEATTSYGAGTRDGPAAIIAASRQIELYDREFGCEPAARIGIHTLPPLELTHRSPEAMIERIAEAVATILSGSPRPKQLVVLGGEHSISAGVALGLEKVIGRQFVVVHVDAHADLREEYEGSRFSHACAARRLAEIAPVFQIGIRSISEGEEAFRRRARHVKTVFADDLRNDSSWKRDLARFVRRKNVYLTIDLDGLDPSVVPAVGTPEPGGLSWWELLEIVRIVCSEAALVPVFDVVELAPRPGFTASDFLAARLVYKTVALSFMRESSPKRRS